MFITDGELDLEGVTRGDVDLENEELVDHIKAVLDSNFPGADRPIIMKISMGLRWVRRQLNPLIGQVENVTLELCIVLLLDVCGSAGNRERFVRLGTWRQKQTELGCKVGGWCGAGLPWAVRSSKHCLYIILDLVFWWAIGPVQIIN